MKRWQVNVFRLVMTALGIAFLWVVLYSFWPDGPIPEPFDFSAAIHRVPSVFAQSHGTQYYEVPAGIVDGANATFSIQFQPLPWAAIQVHRNKWIKAVSKR